MSILVVAEHDNAELKPATLNTLGAAEQLAGHGGGEIHLLVIGAGCRAVAEAAAKIPCVAKVLVSDGAEYEHRIAENVAPLIVRLAPNYGYVLAAATTSGKNVLPRAAALLDVQQVSDICSRSPTSQASSPPIPSCVRSTPATRWQRCARTTPSS